MIANVAEFLLNDLDYMVSMRCVPHQSYKDPAEHVMATLNLGQQCLALARSPMSADEEDLIKSANSMNRIRRVIASERDGRYLTEALRLSTKECVRNLSDIYQKCVFAGKHVQIHDAATEEDISMIHQVCAAACGSEVYVAHYTCCVCSGDKGEYRLGDRSHQEVGHNMEGAT